MYIHIHDTVDIKRLICSVELDTLPRTGEFIVSGESVFKVKAIYHCEYSLVICEVDVTKIKFSDIFND